MNITIRNSAALRKFASELISSTTFKKIVKENNCDFFYSRIKKLEELGQIVSNVTNREIIEYLYEYMAVNYRSEYFYKNTIVNELIRKKEFIQDAVVILNEFKIGKSIADLVFINGVDSVFEIKTELDSPERLRSQLCDYKKMFSEIYIVTHFTLTDKYYSLAEENEVGLIVLDKEMKLKKIINAPRITEYFDLIVMLRSIKKNEMINVIKKIGEEVPQVPNTIFSDHCLSVLKTRDIKYIQRLILNELKFRNLKELKLLKSNEVIDELKHVCVNLNFNKEEYCTLFKFLTLTNLHKSN